MNSDIKKRLREAVDTWASFHGKPDYHKTKEAFFSSLKTFKDITNDKIPTIISYLGYEGFNDETEAIEDLTEKINTYKKFKDPVILYRIVAVKNKKLIKTKDLGEHFTPYKWAIDDDMLRSIGYENWDEDWVPYVMTVSTPLSEIDVLQTIIQNLNFPYEHEVNLKNRGRGAKFIKATKYK